MSGRRIGLALQTDKPAGEYARLATMAEHTGFDVVSVYADLGFQSPLPALLEIARATERVTVGPACLNPFTLHPYELAGFAAALDAASDGRSYLGLARGAWLDAIGVDQRGAVGRVEEAWQVVTRLLRGDDSGFEGRWFRLERGFGLATRPVRPEIPLLVGAWGPTMLAMAGRVGAAEVKVGGTAAPDIVPVARDRVGNSDVDVVVGAVTVVDDDAELARSIARREVAMYVGVVAELDPNAGVDPDLIQTVRSALAHDDPQRAGASIPGDVLDRFALSGTPHQVADQAAALFEAGADRVEFGTPHGVRPERGIELLGRKVIPAIR